jgi:quaternary ammonium compound-resistance protein SugE
MSWLLLALAGVLEVVWAVLLKTASTAHPLRLAAMILAMIASFVLLGRAMRDLPVGTAYAVWTGIGGAGTALVGILWFGESASVARLGALALIVAGVVSLKVVTP